LESTYLKKRKGDGRITLSLFFEIVGCENGMWMELAETWLIIFSADTAVALWQDA
jgi:hypothetical protein